MKRLLLVKRNRSRLAIEAGQQFFAGELAKIHFLSQAQIERAWIDFAARASAGWSFTDCTSKVVIDEFHIRAAAALDMHFRQFGIMVVP